MPRRMSFLAVSRLLAAVVLLGSLGLVGRYLASNGAFLPEEYRVLAAELGANLGELAEILESLSTLL